MKLQGKTHKFGDSINTDYIISGRHKFSTLDMKELAKHIFEDLEPGFFKKVKKGDLLVAGKNFGCGSSREQAPLALKYAGIGAVLAESFARIFYRNAINVGLPLIECDTEGIEPGDELEVDLGKGVVYNRSKKLNIKINPLPEIMIKILNSGGLVEHFKKYGDY
jgi:3-isopropylmalate/(R)-2-methylmalate dehydratase small subunit